MILNLIEQFPKQNRYELHSKPCIELKLGNQIIISIVTLDYNFVL